MTDLLDQLRLEILATTSGNAIANHSAQDGTTTGWNVDPLFTDDTTLSAASGLGFGYSGKAFKIVNIGMPVFNGKVHGESFPIVGNQYANVAVTLRAGTAWTRYYIILSLHFYNLAGVEIGHAQKTRDAFQVSDTDDTTISLDGTLDGGGLGGSLKAPSGTTHARIAIEAGPGSGIGGPSSDLITYLFDVMVVVGTSASGVAGPVFSDAPETWQDMLPKGLSVTVGRGGDVDGVTDDLAAALMTARVKDPLMRPENNERVRPGRPIRLMGLNGDDWESVCRGKIVQAHTDWITEATTDGDIDTPIVTITITDVQADLENYAQALGKSGRFKQRVDSAMINVPVPYTVTDTDADTAQATISVEDNGTALSQLRLIRDSLQGLVYVSRDNELLCFAQNSLPSAEPSVTFSDDFADTDAIFYSTIATTFDSKNIVNTLTVRKRALSEPDGEKVYGPYVNQDSVDAWGSVSAEVIINDGDPATIAADYLAVYSDPQIFTESVTFEVTDTPAQGVVRELYEAVQVKFSKADLDAVYRVIGIEHNITANRDGSKWLVTLHFKPLEASSVIVVTNPPGGPDSGPQDLVPFTREEQSGDVDGTVPVGSTTKDVTVVFAKPYESAPTVVVGLAFLTSTAHVYAAWLLSVTPTKCVIRLSRYEGSGTGSTVNLSATWRATPSL